MKNIISVDLGTTNIKVCIYNSSLEELGVFSKNVTYDTNGDFVEFDPEKYFTDIINLIHSAAKCGYESNGKSVSEIALTGQAESLVMLDSKNDPVAPGISWMDMRSLRECEELSRIFSQEICYKTTGQPELIPTWPITKILWMKKNKPDIFKAIHKYMLLKDYIVFNLCGKALGDHAIYGFSHFFNVMDKCYWNDILEYCDVRQEQLSELAPSGTIAGSLLEKHQNLSIGLDSNTKINIGTLDHFSSMIATGNIGFGIVNESSGTVLSLAAFTDSSRLLDSKLPFYCGPFPDSFVLLPVCESGGYCLEWYKKNFIPEKSFDEITDMIIHKPDTIPPIFLPYIAGTNAPDFNENASGTFFGIRSYHNSADFARSIMEGVSCLLKINLDHMTNAGIRIEKIISTGGGSKSEFWTQLKSDFTGKEINVPKNTEASCLGVAIMSAVNQGYFPSYQAAIDKCVTIEKTYIPQKNSRYKETFDIFSKLYHDLKDVFLMMKKATL